MRKRIAWIMLLIILLFSCARAPQQNRVVVPVAVQIILLNRIGQIITFDDRYYGMTCPYIEPDACDEP